MEKYKKTESEVKRAVAKLKKEIETLEKKAREAGQEFWSLDEDQLIKKERGETSNSPYFSTLSWTSAASAGSNPNFTIHVRNPDPVSYFPVFVTIFFGLGNFFDVGLAWAGRDKRWPEFSERATLPADSITSFSFNYAVPPGAPLGTYLGNSVLWKGAYLGVGSGMDRGSFNFEIL